METDQTKSLSVLAPAKINLYLHITGKRDDGYHTLDSLVAFADIGDLIRIKPARSFSFSIDGPFARGFTAQEQDAGENSSNLVVKAARRLAAKTGKPLDVDIRLTKNLPLAAGIGGGSSDAAATIWGLLEWWGIKPQSVDDLDALLLELGADVPACMACRPVRMSGIGEQIESWDDGAHTMEEMPVLLVNPLKQCPTADIFSRFDGLYVPAAQAQNIDIMSFLNMQQNNLTQAAIDLVPDISKTLEYLNNIDECGLARMSGSGATCFGLFADEMSALDAATDIAQKNPNWWVRTGTLNRAQRY